MTPSDDSKARDKIIFHLKMTGSLTSGELARKLGITSIAVRQHLTSLEDDGLVAHTSQKGKVGRPAHVWTLTPRAESFFPDRHRELVGGLLEAIRSVFGEGGLRQVVQRWSEVESAKNASRLDLAGCTLSQRVAAIVGMRRDQGYMAEWRKNDDGSIQLVENHCPINAAARGCDEICEGEIETFARLLGSEVTLERKEHIGSGDRRCVYEIRPGPAS